MPIFDISWIYIIIDSHIRFEVILIYVYFYCDQIVIYNQINALSLNTQLYEGTCNNIIKILCVIWKFIWK